MEMLLQEIEATSEEVMVQGDLEEEETGVHLREDIAAGEDVEEAALKIEIGAI